MTRRQRHLRILDNFGGLRGLTGSHRVKWEFDRLISIHGLDLLTDEAVEMLASRTVSSHRFTQRINRENRARRQA
jgi:hypothetical protein